MSVILEGNQFSPQNQTEAKGASLLEPDQEVAAVLCGGIAKSQTPTSTVRRPVNLQPIQEVKTEPLESTRNKSEVHLSGDSAAQYPSIHFLAAQGEVAKIKEEIDRGTDINSADKAGLTPLAWAAAHRQKATVTLLLKHGADVTICSPNGENALAFATCQGQLEVVEQILAQGADPNVTTLDGATPLMFAAYSGYPQVAKVLLEHGADLTATNNEGQTALAIAVGMGNKNVQRVIDDYMRSILER
ncbi:ankyrin repeat family A protein 2 isoform X2 [Nematostella vectensis]|uniref:ankyrin repeat family A protein 2 isoform X2 n=1 Tax=Nematostella vectensis TaxID=45351 RepID=UPI00138FAFB6|nr:ankyrin repeat family A protein 2 isoform X2 [Nematostella vectensis]